MQGDLNLFCLDKKCDLPSRVATTMEEVFPHWQRKHENAVDLNGLNALIDKDSHPLQILMTQYDYRDQKKFITERVMNIRQLFEQALVKFQDELLKNLSELQQQNKFLAEMFNAVRSRKIDEVLKFKDHLALLHEDCQPVMVCLQQAQQMWSTTNQSFEAIQRNILGLVVKYPKFRWSEQKKFVTITIEGNQVINQAEWGMALLEPALGRDEVCSVLLKHTNIGVPWGWHGGTKFALVDHNRLQQSNPEYTGHVREGDGFYGMFGLEGKFIASILELFFEKSKSLFGAGRSFDDLPNDTVRMTWDGPRQLFILSSFHKETRKSIEYQMKFEGNAEHHFAVYLSKNKVELLY